MNLTEPEKVVKKYSLNQTVNDCKLQDKQYEKLDCLLDELDDHLLNGRYSEYDLVFKQITKLNKEITDTENRCRSRLGMKKL